MTISNLLEDTSSDWDFCQSALEQVSRTFAQPIAFLPEAQRRALTVGYLLCRVADTIEDCVGLEDSHRDTLFSLFQGLLRNEVSTTKLKESCRLIRAPESELRLIENIDRVMGIFLELSARTQRTIVRWVSEMADGMRLYARRSEGTAFNAMIGMEDLERYCYFVAGTVGHLITELFDEATGFCGLEPRLRDNAESFGLGLQMVNIVKDVTDDFERGVCYLPRQVCRAEGIEPEDLLNPECRVAAKRVAAQVIERATMHLDAALEYTLSIPAEHHHLRLFCLLPLWMAVETLSLARDNDAVFEAGQKVKISRDTVGRIIADCGRDCRDDAALRASFHRLKSGAVRIAIAN